MVPLAVLGSLACAGLAAAALVVLATTVVMAGV
jgi:hypothetical protein